jgi:hypothetical protein
MVTGAAAASGYYFGSLYFHRRPNWLLLIQMILIAGATQLLIYYLQYTTLVLDDGTKASDLVSFARYLDISLTSAHYRIGRGAQVDTGAVGDFGYWLAVIQCVGFLAGGLFIYVAFSHIQCVRDARNIFVFSQSGANILRLRTLSPPIMTTSFVSQWIQTSLQPP